MPTLRERAARLLTGPTKVDAEREQITELANALLAAYQEGPYILPPEELQRQLMEQYDSEYVLDLVDRLQWEQFGGYQSGMEDQRIRAVNDSKRMWLYSVVAQWIIRLWTYYAVGESIEVIPTDDSYPEENEKSAGMVWDEFWTADRNSPVLATEKLHDISNMLLVTGNRFFAFFIAELDGETTIRRVKPMEIVDIIRHPDDDSVALFYKRQWLEKSAQQTAYYPDWRWWFDDKYNTDALPTGVQVVERARTGVCMLHSPFEQKDEDSLFGWPLLAPAGTPWLRSHRQFFENRLAVSRSVASYVRRRTTKGGSRAVDAIRASLASTLQSGGTSETNPPPVAGSEDITNQAVQTTDLPMRTGASDAKTDGEMFSWMAGLAGGIFPHYLGLGDAYRLATATSMEKPLFMQFSLYRNRLSAIFRDMVRIVLQSKEKYGQVQYQTYKARIAADRLIELDLPMISEAAGTMFRDIIAPQQALGTIPDEMLEKATVYVVQSILQAMGAEDVEEMVNIEQYEGLEEEPEEETELTEQKGQPLPEWPDEPVPITDEDIDDAIEWAKKLDPEIAAMLQATNDEAASRG